MGTDHDRLIDHGERLARMETKLDALLERQKRWGAVWPAIVSAVTSGIVVCAFKFLTQVTQ